MRILSWNTNRRTGTHSEQLGFIGARSPDVVALQEVTTSTLPRWKAGLPTTGLKNIVDSFELSPAREILTGRRRYGELIASRFPLEAFPPERFDVPWPERILSARVRLGEDSIDLHTAHVPPGASNGWIKIETLEGIYERLACSSEHARVLCGDFNSPQAELEDGTLVTWGQRILSSGEVVVRNRKKKGSGKLWDRGERKVLEGLSEYGFRDAYRETHGYDCEKDYSWVWKRKGERRYRRFDHLLVGPHFEIVDCKYLHSALEKGLSDHAPIEGHLRLSSPFDCLG